MGSDVLAEQAPICEQLRRPRRRLPWLRRGHPRVPRRRRLPALRLAAEHREALIATPLLFGGHFMTLFYRPL